MGLQPVAYYSAKMSSAEMNYDVREQEFLALFKACSYWRHYLHGTQPFTLLTDHESLKYHKSMPNLTGRLARWIETMSQFDYQLRHIPGKDNVVADALSRRVDHATQDSDANIGTIQSRGGRKRRQTRRTTQRVPESAEQRQRNIAAATQIQPPDTTLPAPNKHGVILTPTQRCSANTNSGQQCAQRTAVAHVCWNHLRRDMGVRVQNHPYRMQGKDCMLHGPMVCPRDIEYHTQVMISHWNVNQVWGHTCYRLVPV